jgi:hypothetical protein
MTETIVVLDPLNETSAARLRALLPPGMVLTHGTARGDAHLKEIIAEADYAIAGQVGVSGDVLRAARKLKLLHKWGVGVDNLDLEAARACGIRVARTTGSNAVPVAEFTIGLIIATLRNQAYGHAELKKGEWRGGRMPQDSYQLSGKTDCPADWYNQARNVAPTVNGEEIVVPRHLVVATRVNPNAVKASTRRLQIRAWNRNEELGQEHRLPPEAAVDVASAHLFGMFRALRLRENALALALSV